MLCIATDYKDDQGSAEPYLPRIAHAGFSHVHWCHEWETDYLYSDNEVVQIKTWLDNLGLKVIDLHASKGIKKDYGSRDESIRAAGVELVKNRIAMTSRLGGDVIVLHLPPRPADDSGFDNFYKFLYKSLDEIEPYAKQRGVRIALENGDIQSFNIIERVLKHYEPEYIGICYDSGHGNVFEGSLDALERNKSRLLALHLHDNDGADDRHDLLFSGTLDWERLARIIAESSYKKCSSMEVNIHGFHTDDEAVFLKEAFETGRRFQGRVDNSR
jgi:sugar phosphate isomerase/epimerase